MPCATSHFKENKATGKRIQLKCVHKPANRKAVLRKKKKGYEREKRGGRRDLKAGLRKEAQEREALGGRRMRRAI